MRYWIFAKDRADKNKPMECDVFYSLSSVVKKVESYGEYTLSNDLICPLPILKNGKVIEEGVYGAKEIKPKQGSICSYDGGWMVTVVQEDDKNL